MTETTMRVAALSSNDIPAAGFEAGSRAAVMDELRRLLRPPKEAWNAALPFGLPALDDHLPEGGLAGGALHEIIAASPDHLPAAFGFITAILARIGSPSLAGEGLGVGIGRPCVSVDASASPRDYPPRPKQTFYRPPVRPLLFVIPADGFRAYGFRVQKLCADGRHPGSVLSQHILSGHGLNGLGLDPGRVVLVETAHRKETLWALAEALHSGVPAAVVGMIDRLDLKTSQKLQLAASDFALPLLLLRPAPTLETSAAATRWRVGTVAAARDRFGLYARPRWHLQLERCRNGRPGEWVVEYDHVAHRFSLAAALADPALCHSTSDQSANRRSRQQAG